MSGIPNRYAVFVKSGHHFALMVPIGNEKQHHLVYLAREEPLAKENEKSCKIRIG